MTSLPARLHVNDAHQPRIRRQPDFLASEADTLFKKTSHVVNIKETELDCS